MPEQRRRSKGIKKEKDKKENYLMNVESMPASTVLFIYDITALKCP